MERAECGHLNGMMNSELKRFCLLLAVLCPTLVADAQSTAFTYTGRLTDDGVPVSGAYDLRFTVFDLAADGLAVAGPLEFSPVEVTSGLFSVRVDFGADIFVGPARWLGIEVRPTGAPDFTPFTSRQEITSSPYAIRAQTAGTVAEGAVTAGQLNTDVAPTPGQLLSYDGANLLWSDPGIFTGDVWSLNGVDAYYSAGNVGIGTSTVSPGIRLEVNGTTRFAPGGSGGVIQFGTPAGETGLAILGNNRADIRFDNDTLKFAVGYGSGAPPAANGLAISTSGKVGIGTLYPSEHLTVGGNSAADTKIEVNAGGNSYAAMRFFNSAGSWLWQVTPSNDAPGGRMRLTDEWSGAERIAITREGNVGMGTTAPVAKLQAETSEAAKIAMYGVVGSTSSVGVYGSANAASSVGVWGHNPAGLAVYADGNAGQARDKGGFVKAMAFINPFLPADQYVVRCYNSLLAGNAATTLPCGITVSRIDAGRYFVDFGLKVDDRFISVTPVVLASNVAASTGAAGPTSNPNIVFVRMSDSTGVTRDGAFYIFIY